jgi:hypothetical protein
LYKISKKKKKIIERFSIVTLAKNKKGLAREKKKPSLSLTSESWGDAGRGEVRIGSVAAATPGARSEVAAGPLVGRLVIQMKMNHDVTKRRACEMRQ